MTREPGAGQDRHLVAPQPSRVGEPMQEDHRPAPVTSYSMPASPVSALTNLPLIASDDGQQLTTAWGQERLVAPPGAQRDLVEQAWAGTHLGSPAQHHGDAGEAPQAVGSSKAALARAWPISQPGSPAPWRMSASISARR